MSASVVPPGPAEVAPVRRLDQRDEAVHIGFGGVTEGGTLSVTDSMGHFSASSLRSSAVRGTRIPGSQSHVHRLYRLSAWLGHGRGYPGRYARPHGAVLGSRILLRPTDPERSRVFYGEQLGLAVYREFATGPERGTVYFLGGGFLELSGRSDSPAGAADPATRLWLQVADVVAPTMS
ncbi:hypothetical protein SHIRM173S_05022 [Streptomyces hirsutus]